MRRKMASFTSEWSFWCLPHNGCNLGWHNWKAQDKDQSYNNAKSNSVALLAFQRCFAKCLGM
jgi:hypothetical protein